MKCNKCDHPLTSDSKYCEKCGTKIEKEDMSKLKWDEFIGISNNDDALIRKSKALSEAIIRCSIDIAKSIPTITDDGKEKDMYIKLVDNKYMEIIFYNTFYFMHFADRIAYSALGDEKRKIFIDSLFLETREYLVKLGFEGEINIEKARKYCNNHWNIFQTEYGQYKMYAEKDESLNKTIGWEIGRTTSKLLFEKDNSRFELFYPILIANYVSFLNIAGLILGKY